MDSAHEDMPIRDVGGAFVDGRKDEELLKLREGVCLDQ